MKILVISDINWESAYINEAGRSTTTEKHIIKIINTNTPDLVLFPGDIISDGTCSYVHLDEFVSVLKHLELRKIKSLFIQGNHDECAEYDELLDKIHQNELKYTQEISGKTVHINNIVIHGLSYRQTHTRPNIRQSKRSAPNSIDILLTHPNQFVRPLLFDFEPKLMICGHSGCRIAKIKNTILLSSGCFTDTTIDYKTNRNMTIVDKQHSVVVSNGSLVFKKDGRADSGEHHAYYKAFTERCNHVSDSKYKHQIETLLDSKKKLKNGTPKTDILHELIKTGIPKSHITTYLSMKN